MIDRDFETVRSLYENFNARNIDGVIAVLAPDADWANGMDGGYVHGHEALREYWTRQWAIVSPHVEPMKFSRAPDATVVVEVMQTVRDLDGQLLQGQTHGLKDKIVRHAFRLKDGMVARFDIQEGAGTESLGP